MVSKTESGSASVKSNSSKFSVKSIKSAFSKASKSKAVKAEDPVNAAVENTDARETAESENPLDASQITQLQEIVNNAVASTLSKVMGEDEEVASKKSVSSRTSKKSIAASVAPEKQEQPDTIVEEEEEAPKATEEEIKEETPEEAEVAPVEAETETILAGEAIMRNMSLDETPKTGFFCFQGC
mmetsp:Transcript_16375/g.23368  ORF Transcript_16375/g.23368 Transcript_16375/m.23368 type:complete len:184 (+) Transcript_16375:173-724(+)|eukprot:CAMPEP_0172414448 /NCGR_PEP_ID=MMETSP1064-20121228/1099_1 /TAXON_ID=202472 /ORGANISM="Aulacoseira subarctica , Strain CCAP 1002/5" /LENGTH=183 /DNA_ID=CAMNT_0013151119 /DNA_START=130 /DNA_END=681 /DNA_ORIENTATION=+